MFELENLGQGHEGEKLDLRRSIINVWMYIAELVVIVLAFRQHTKTTEFTYTHTHTARDRVDDY